jgi:hypothetical protein
LAQLIQGHLTLKIRSSHFGAASGTRSALELVTAGNTDVIDSSSAASEHSAKSASATTHAAHSRHGSFSKVVRHQDEYADRRNKTEERIAKQGPEKPSKRKADGERYNDPHHLLTNPVQ